MTIILLFVVFGLPHCASNQRKEGDSILTSSKSEVISQSIDALGHKAPPPDKQESTAPIGQATSSKAEQSSPKAEQSPSRQGSNHQVALNTISPEQSRGYTAASSEAHAARITRNSPATIYSSKRIKTDSIGVFFRQDKYILDPKYRSNPEQLAALKHILTAGYHIDSIRIYAFASPEGVYERNQYLSKRRSEALKSWMFAQMSKEAIESCSIELYPLGEDWIGFRREIEEKYYGSDREKVLSIIDSDIKLDTKKWRLQQLNNGATWRHLISNYAPKQRQAASVIVYYRQLPIADVVIPYESIYIEDEAPLEEYEAKIELPEAEPMIVEVAEPHYKTIAAVKTNLLFDAVTALNYSLEIPIGDHFSIVAQHTFPWWLSKDNKYCFQFRTYGGELRYWFGKKGHGVLKQEHLNIKNPVAPKPAKTSYKLYDQRLQGHFIGLYAYAGSTDLQAKLKPCYQAQFVSAGISYGFAFPISNLFNLEFSIAAGWARIHYQHYTPSEDWQILYRDYNDYGAMDYFGPTKLEVSLVLPIRAKVKGGTKR